MVCKVECNYCRKKIKKGIVDHGFAYCSQKHANADWRENLADRWTEHESDGLYHTFEDYMENERGAVIADDHYYHREC